MKLEILGGRPTPVVSLLYLDSILLMWLKVVWICSWKVIEVGWLYTRASGSHYFTFVQC
jgi:hypothetical protein